MNADSIFLGSQLSSHLVCQDYTRSSPRDPETLEISGVPYALLSDGCSGARDTDLGARLLTLVAEKRIGEWESPACGELSRFFDSVIEEADALREALGIADRDSLAATLLAARVSGGRFFAVCYGDGAIGARRRNGPLDLYDLSNTTVDGDSMPNYPLYRLGNDLREQYDRSSVVKRLTVWELGPEAGAPGPGRVEEVRSDFTVVSGDVDDYDFIAIASDGVHSFRAADRSTPVPVEEIALELFGYPSLDGMFVQRRVKRFLEQKKRAGWTHDDDLSVAAVSFREAGDDGP